MPTQGSLNKKPAIYKFSIVIPAYKTSKSIELISKSIFENSNLNSSEIEIIFVNDGCPEDSWLEIKKFCKLYSNIKGISLSRNFGQHIAITAGLANAKGDFIFVMDCDLQENPKYLKKMYESLISKDLDIIFTKKKG